MSDRLADLRGEAHLVTCRERDDLLARLAAAEAREARVRALLDGAPAAHGYVLASDLRAALDG